MVYHIILENNFDISTSKLKGHSLRAFKQKQLFNKKKKINQQTLYL